MDIDTTTGTTATMTITMGPSTHDAPSATPRMPRRHDMDALRGIAVLLMIEQHLGVWLWSGKARHTGRLEHLPLVAFNALGGLAAPLFITLAGIGSALLVSSSVKALDRTLALRGLTLMGFGIALNLLTPSWFSAGSWYVLHMMGFAMVTTPLWRRCSDRALVATMVLVLLATWMAQTVFETPLPLTNGRMRNTELPGGSLRLALLEGQFPILPWLAFYLAGLVSGRALIRGDVSVVTRLGFSCVFVGLGLAAAFVARVPGTRTRGVLHLVEVHLGFYPASVAAALCLLGLSALAVRLAIQWGHKRKPTANHPLVTLGRASLTLLLLHVVVFRELTRPIGWWQALAAWQALAVIAAFSLACAYVTRKWQRHGYRYGAEWLLRQVA